MPIPINTLMRAVVANPDAYADAFPVAEPPRPADTMTCWGDLGRSGREFLARMAELTDPITSFEGGLPAQPAATMVQAHLNRDSVAWRGLDRARDRVDGSYSVRMTPVRYHDCLTQFVTDDSLDSDEVRFIGGPNPSQQVRVTGLRGHRLEQRVYGDGMGEQAWGDSMADQTERLQLLAGQRPTHYRVHPGRCACGFESIYSADMETHLLGPSGHNWLTVCECGLKTYCREVRVPRAPSLSLNASFDPTQGPTDDQVWLCVGCRERRGIH